MQSRGGGRRGGFGQGREGFRGGRQGRGRGRTDSRFNKWNRRDEIGTGDHEEATKKNEEVIQENPPQEQIQDNSKWEGRNTANEKQPITWGLKGGDATPGGGDTPGEGNTQNPTNPDTHHLGSHNQRVACENCALYNLATKDCRRNLCEICGFNNHSTYDCKRCVPWSVGPELCAAQVENQSFYIDECIDPWVAKEKASTAVISVVSGSVNAKQIEMEFMNLIGAGAWRWQARPVAEGEFLLRFPIAKMVFEWSLIKFLTMRNEAQIMIEAWSPAVGAKGVLQSSWFRVSSVPADQRSIRTLAKVGGLVGKVIEIDEGTRYRHDYVRMRISCRDVSRVPKTAEDHQPQLRSCPGNVIH